MKPRLLIIGAGVMGVATAYYARQLEASVKLMDMSMIGNPQAASSDHQRAFRFSYAANREYVAWAKAALPLWRDIERESGQSLLNLCGMLFLGHGDSSYAMQSYRTLRDMGEAVDLLTPAEIAARWPQFNAAALELDVLDRNGGFVAAQQAVLTLAKLAHIQTFNFTRERALSISEKNGEVYVKTNDTTHVADMVIVTVNGWVNKLLGVNYVTNTQQPVMYFAANDSTHSYRPTDFPVFADLDEGYYGFPTAKLNAVKVANHTKGAPITDPDQRGEPPTNTQQDMRRWLGQFIPELANRDIVEQRVCFYDNSTDDDFIIDRLPGSQRIIVACGFSGHGFKFAPLIGKLLANLALCDEEIMPLDSFRISRLKQV